MRRIAYYLLLPYLAIAFGFMIPLRDISEAFGSLARVAGVPAGFAWLLAIIQEGRVSRPSAFVWALMAFFGFSILSIFWTVSNDGTMFNAQRFLVYFATTVVTWDLVRTREQLRGALIALLFAGIAICVTLFLNSAESNTVMLGRVSALGLHPNLVPRILGMLFPLSWCLALEYPVKNPLLKGFFLSFPVIGTVAMLLTGSRGGLVSCLPAYIYLLISIRRIGPNGLAGAGLIGGTGLIVALTKINLSYQLGRIATLFGGRADQYDTGDLSSGRTQIWEGGARLVGEHIGFGVGSGAFPEATRFEALPKGPDGSPLVAHNTYLSVLAETGVVGFSLFMILIGIVIDKLRRLPPGFKAAWIASFSVWALGATTGTWEVNGQTYIIMNLIMVTERMYRVEVAKAAAESEQTTELAAPSPWGRSEGVPA
jgi:O-antigen ligase